jgi:hypothetical protein
MNQPSPQAKPRHWLDAWPWPWIWIFALPVVTVPPTILLRWMILPHCHLQPPSHPEAAQYACPTGLLVGSLLPGLWLLAALLWLRSDHVEVHEAAVQAGQLAVIRFLVPVVDVIRFGEFAPLTTGFLAPPLTPGSLVSILLWLASWGFALRFEWRWDRRQPVEFQSG